MVSGGVVRGETEADLVVFRGIPYAALPVRFGLAVRRVAGFLGLGVGQGFGELVPGRERARAGWRSAWATV